MVVIKAMNIFFIYFFDVRFATYFFHVLTRVVINHNQCNADACIFEKLYYTVPRNIQIRSNSNITCKKLVSDFV